MSKAQFGFQPGRETLMHIMRLLDRLKDPKSAKGGKRLKKFLVFFDFSSAFDGIDHQLLIKKLEENTNSSKNSLNFLKWYLNQIKLKVGKQFINQNKGSPQGGIVSPYLWLLYMNDLVAELVHTERLRNVFAFADDLLVVCENEVAVRRVIRIVRKWSEDNKIKLNEKKSTIMPLSKRKMKKDEIEGHILQIPLVKEYKYLGIVFSYDMKADATLLSAAKKSEISRAIKY